VRQAHLACGKETLAKIGDLGEALGCHTLSFPGLGRYADPPPRRVLLFWVLGRDPRVDGAPRADYPARDVMFAYCGAGSNSRASSTQPLLIHSSRQPSV
jgi:hypothetical protein